MFTGLKNNMVGPPAMNNTVPQVNQGLMMPYSGKAMFNMGGMQNNAPAPEISGPMTMNISRTASSDPVQNVINDIGNPLGGLRISMTQAPAKPSMPQAFNGQPLTNFSTPQNIYPGSSPFMGPTMIQPYGSGSTEMLGMGPNILNLMRPGPQTSAGWFSGW